MTLLASFAILALAQAAADTSRPEPAMVLTAPATAGLQARADWASRTARERGFLTWWVGWAVAGDSTGRTWYYIDRKSHGAGGYDSFVVMGSGNFEFDGAPLAAHVGARPPYEIAMLLRYTQEPGGAPVLDGVHAGSFVFAVHFGGLPLLWLGQAADGESVARLRGEFEVTADAELQRSLVSMVAAHTTSSVVAPVLASWLDNDALLVSTRRTAAHLLGPHADSAGIAVLTRRVRADTSVNLRTTAMRSLARAATPAETVPILTRLAREDSSARIRQSAISALGTIRDPSAFRALVDFVESPGDPAATTTRQQAMRVVSQQARSRGEPVPQEVLDLLMRVARNDTVATVRVAAVDALANLRDPRTISLLAQLARAHSDPGVQQRAVRGLGRSTPPDSALEPLRQIIWEHPRPDVQSAAVRALIQLQTERARDLLVDVAERHPRPEARRAAVQAVVNMHFR